MQFLKTELKEYIDIGRRLDNVVDNLDFFIRSGHFKNFLRFYRESRSESPTDHRQAVDLLFDKIHDHFNCGVAYDFLHNFYRNQVSFEGLVSMYVVTLCNAFSKNSDQWYCQGLMMIVDEIMRFLRRIRMWGRLCTYELRNKMTWLTGPNVVTLRHLAKQCFQEQIQDSRLVTNIILRMYIEHGHRPVVDLWSVPPDESDRGICFLRQMLGRPTYGRYSYYVRALNDTMSEIGDYRLNLYLPYFVQEEIGSIRIIIDEDIFHYGARYPIRYYNDIVETPFRRIVLLAIRFLPMYLRSLGNYTDIHMFLVRQEVRGILLNQHRLTDEEQFLIQWDLMFRTITDPLVSLKEIREYCEFARAEEDVAEAICFSYSTLFPKITAEDLTPRRLKHLARCRIRKALYEAWQQPEAVFQLEEFAQDLQNYINLSEA